MAMNRRGFLKALLSVPVVAAAASLPSIAVQAEPIAAALPAVKALPQQAPAHELIVDVSFRIDQMAWQLYAQKNDHYVCELWADEDWRARKDSILDGFKQRAAFTLRGV